ncbi:MFS transporter [Roseimicrobium gellanilyticum]|uniref:MFS transporter n=1 Tax=Roseimicrobium gellanilyticum TaxID=748857 RepID=A0A366H327_9BACT|nr:MFS transporter [Roseimicrobium gellanilyticum]RBP35676.1 MFS transporter [Roseimicrobium gellanilyticum]
MSNDGIAPNAKRLLWAGFMAILAAGVGFAIRGQIFDVWRAKFGFTGLEVGLVGGAGFTGFCFGIIIGGVIVDKIGYGKLVVAALLFHVLSAVVTFGAMDGMATKTAFVYLWTGTFLFAVANGTLEAVANPLVATLFPNNRTHYLNILHASWPLGMVLGGSAGAFLGEQFHWGWKAQLALFLVPTAIYALMFMGQKFPKSEASQKGLGLGQMLKDVGIMGAAVIGLFIGLFFKDGLGPLLAGFTGSDFFSSSSWMWISVAIGVATWLLFSGLSGWAVGAWLLFVLFITHALVGAVELGTDGWIQNITGNILTPIEGKYLFIATSALMFALRFCAHFIEKNLKLSPIGILLVCALIACLGLNMVAGVTAFGGALGAVLIYGVGKTFFWPTMLAVVGDRFPSTGAVAMSIMGGIGMMSAGLVGSPGLGYAKDRFAGESLASTDAALYQQYKAEKPSAWMGFILDPATGLDGKKLGEAKTKLGAAREELVKAGTKDPQAAYAKLTPEEQKVLKADIEGDRKTLRADAFIPAAMAVIYLLLLLYFKGIGGYKPVSIETERITGGVNAPMEA